MEPNEMVDVINTLKLARQRKGTAAFSLAHTWQVCPTVCGAVGVVQIGIIYGLVAKLGGHA